jgi:cytochrome c oxidase cbb3-type subunit 3
MKTLHRAIVTMGVAAWAAAMGGPPRTTTSWAATSSTAETNPFKNDAAAIKEGRALYQNYGCSGCHGVGGGGGMAVPVIDDTWSFGSDDQTLFKLIKGEIPDSTMPRTFGSIPDDEIWKMLAYIRSQYSGDPNKVNR